MQNMELNLILIQVEKVVSPHYLVECLLKNIFNGKMIKKKIHIVLWLHDVEALRYAQVDGITRMRRRTLLLEEKSVLKKW